MRVGVITFSESKDNYGQILQAYAMQKYLEKKGHTPFLIRYHNTQIKDSTGFKFRNIWTYLSQLPKYIKWYLNKKKIIQQERAYQQSANFVKRDFLGFIKKYIESTDFYTADTIHSNPPVADAYICGSDQIWGGDDAYYLSFAPTNSIKIAYAPSLGGLSFFSSEKEDKIRYLISRFDRIGMREQSGVDVCHRLGRTDAEKVVDPTLLLSSNDYIKIIKKSKLKSRYALVYLLGNPIDVKIDVIVEYNKFQGLETVYVASQGRDDNQPKIDPTINEWLGLIQDADLVITNSFHCVVFSLQFHRNFIAIPLTDGYERMNTRIDELLRESNLSSRFTNDLYNLDNLTERDFDRFEEYRTSQQKNSDRFLNIIQSN